VDEVPHPHTLFLNQSYHNPLPLFFLPKIRKNMVFFFLRVYNGLKTRKRGLKLKGASMD